MGCSLTCTLLLRHTPSQSALDFVSIHRGTSWWSQNIVKVYASIRQLSKWAYHWSCLSYGSVILDKLTNRHRGFQDHFYWEGARMTVWGAGGNFNVLLISITLSSWESQYLISSVFTLLVYLFALHDTQVQKLSTKEVFFPYKTI